MLVMTDGQSGPGNVDQRITEQEEAARVLGVELVWGHIPDLAVAAYEARVIHLIEHLLKDTGAERMYTHAPDDSHQDHRAVALCSIGAGRNMSQIITYESPSARHFVPDMYVGIEDTLEEKVKALECHASQVEASNRVNMDFIRNQARYHGGIVRCGAAEAFMVERMLLDI